MKATHKPLTTPTLDAYYTPAALLRGAALYLWHYGWTRGEIFGAIDTDTPFPPACTIGAINIAAHGSPILCSDNDAQEPSVKAAMRAIRVFAAYLDAEYAAGTVDRSAIDIVGDYNDNPDTALDELVDLLREAADDWDTIHNTGGTR